MSVVDTYISNTNVWEYEDSVNIILIYIGFLIVFRLDSIGKSNVLKGGSIYAYLKLFLSKRLSKHFLHFKTLLKGEKNMTNKNLLPTNLIQNSKIEECIYNIRGYQVMLDSDIAVLFDVETKRINEQMKRNKTRFPEDFCFQLNSLEFKTLKSQNAASNIGRGGKQKLPFVYTEHGIIALAGVLKSEVADKMSVEIARTFIQMRKLFLNDGGYLIALAKLQNRQIEFENEANRKFDEIFKIIHKNDYPKEALLYSGQFYDSFEHVSKLISKANKNIVLVDPYCDEKVFAYLKHKKQQVNVEIYKSDKTLIPADEMTIFESQYGKITITIKNDIHDRFLIIDENECYSLGTSLNHMGKKLFSIIKLEDKKTIKALLDRLQN